MFLRFKSTIGSWLEILRVECSGMGNCLDVQNDGSTIVHLAC